MSGHSKWSQIKRQKGANDAKRGALFTKLTREIITAARQGGGDVDGNYRLRMAVDKARANSMPADNIKRAIDRATGSGDDAEQYEEITYEGFGPSNVAVIVAAMTDNRNRTASEIRSAFNKVGGSLAPVAWQFEHRGVVSIPLNGRDPDDLTLAAIDAGAADVEAPDGGSIVVYTDPADLERVRTTLADRRLRGRVGRALDGADHEGRAQRREDRQGGALLRRAPGGSRGRAGRLRELRHPGRPHGGPGSLGRLIASA